MNIQALHQRFVEERKLHVGDVSILKKVWYYWDYFVALMVHGASINDYFVYKFFQLRHNGRKEYITFRRYNRIKKICNPDAKAIEICRDKIKFNKYLSEYLGRKWLDVNDSTFDQFSTFLDSIGDTFFVKAIDSFRGIGVRSYTKGSISYKDLYDKLFNNPESRYIIEEKIEQEGEIADFHKWSINTIRIVTVYDTVNDKVNILNANLRVGRGRDHRDNLHSGGIAVQIDIETGIMFSPGFDMYNELYLVHPDSKKQFIGFKVPFWNECKDFIIKVASKLPTVRYVGWDIVSKGDGTFTLIEANDNADHDIQQLNNKPMWESYKRILKNLK